MEITESVKKKIRVAVKGLGLKPTDYTKIYKALQEIPRTSRNCIRIWCTA